MAKRSEYTIQGPLAPGSPASQLHKSLTVRRDKAPDLRALYRHSADLTADGSPMEPTVLSNGSAVDSKPLPNGVPTTPNLPPTPPAANGESLEQPTEDLVSEAATRRSTLVTPNNQNSPPTPDNTPPRPQRHNVIRPWLGAQASFASTRAESFKTAREDMNSDDDSVIRGLQTQASRSVISMPMNNERSQDPPVVQLRPPLFAPQIAGPSARDAHHEIDNDATPRKHLTVNHAFDIMTVQEDSVKNVTAETLDLPSIARRSPEPSLPEEIPHTSHEAAAPPRTTRDPPHTVSLRRGPSLRDRLKAAQRDSPSASTEKFANIIGWTHSVTPEPMTHESMKQDIIAPSQESKRLSSLSTTSTVGAMVLDSSPLPKRRTTLRKMQKTDSLRSASSPLPASNTTPNSQSDSPHRLIHKKARLSNQHRHSYGSDKSRSHSLSSSAVVQKPEIIKVAVIPERSSSLQSSANSSKRHSLSNSSGRTHSKKPSDGLPPSSWQRKRTLSESDRGREKQQTLTVPARSSSFSAPTSQSTSRANSLTSESLRKQRLAAETDLRKTLDRMESERLLSSLRGSQLENSPIETPSKPPQSNVAKGSGQTEGGRQKSLTPGSTEWAALRPSSVLETPFSQTSYKSGSPDIIEATQVSFFPHTNHSLQLIESNIMQQSRAVREVRKKEYVKDQTSSPLRNPRRPPEPPQFNVIPPSPGNEVNNQLGAGQAERRRSSTSRRPSQRRSDSFVKSLTRGLSLKNATNRKASQDLDSNLHPMWRPQGFWDDLETSRGGADHALQTRAPVNNSLGLPQERTVITGPVSLVRRISERRKQRQALVKQSSRGSLSRLRATQQLYMVPSGTSGVNWFMNLRGIPDKMLHAKQRKEDERRERRRAILRQSIGANVVSQGDSRFPAGNSNLARA